MSIANYSDLQAAISDWMARSDVSGKAVDFITLAEARLNRLLGVVGTTATLTGTISSAELDISSLSVQEPQNLYIGDGESELCMTPRALGRMEPYPSGRACLTSSLPRFRPKTPARSALS
jgi:hypothetical protein